MTRLRLIVTLSLAALAACTADVGANGEGPARLRATLALAAQEIAALRARLATLPPLNPENQPAAQLRLRDCQETAITNLEQSLVDTKNLGEQAE